MEGLKKYLDIYLRRFARTGEDCRPQQECVLLYCKCGTSRRGSANCVPCFEKSLKI